MDAWKRYKENGDEEAYAMLVEAYTPLVRRISRRIFRKKPSSLDEEDLFQSGMIGLIDAINKFDPSRDILFSTFSQRRIQGSIYDDINMLDWTPRLVRDRIKLVLKSEEYYRRQGRDVATPEEISVIAKEQFDKDITPAQVVEAQAQARKTYVHPVENSAVIEHEENTSPGFVNASNSQGVEEYVFNTEMRAILIEVITAECSALESAILSETLVNERSLKDVANDLGISPARASLLRRDAVERVRLKLHERGVESLNQWTE